MSLALFTLGINHHSAPVSVREQVAFHAETLSEALAGLVRAKPVKEAAILSTCNRTELYCATETPEAAADWLPNTIACPAAPSSPTCIPCPSPRPCAMPSASPPAWTPWSSANPRSWAR